jgi:hypothetical protein
MTTLAVLVFATPVFGLRLSAPALQPGSWFAAPETAVDVEAALPLPTLLQAAGAADADRRYAEAVRQRAELGQIHRTMGIITWASMTVTVLLGMIQFYNLYGFGDGQDDNPCATGRAVFGQDQCWGTPWPHATSALITTSLYAATLSMSIGLLLNDPNEVLTGRGAYSDRIRAHSVLALVHLAGMLAQTFIGIGLANGWFGDRANNYSDLQTVATLHQVIGWTTWAALGTAGAIMLF